MKINTKEWGLIAYGCAYLLWWVCVVVLINLIDCLFKWIK